MNGLPFRAPMAAGQLEMRCRHLHGLLVEAEGELEAALLASNTMVMVAASRRVAAIGFLLHEAADKYDRGNQTGPGASLLEDRGTGARKDTV